MNETILNVAVPSTYKRGRTKFYSKYIFLVYFSNRAFGSSSLVSS